MAPNKPEISPDVMVIGGGPGGSTAATMLARKGIRVLLLERERFPRDHVGESLLPASLPVLEELGVLPAVQRAGFLLKWGATMVWGKDQRPWNWYFKETNLKYPHSYQVWRPQFDQMLLDNSRSHGVAIREGHRVLEVLFEHSRACGVRYVDDSGKERTARADFIVDASGQGGLLGRQLGLRQWDAFFQNLAVYGYFTGGSRPPGPDENNIFIESYPQGWLWSIPLHTGWSSVGAVVDSRAGQTGIQRCGARDFLARQIAQSPHTARMLENAELVSGPFIVKDWSYMCEQMVGDGYILVGDAACFVDPLFSSGVHLALMSGVLASAYVTSALQDPGLGEAAKPVYQELYRKEYRHFRELARLFYSSNRTAESYFWEARRILESDETLTPRHAFIQAVAGQPPRGYERAVLGHGELPPTFTESVSQVEFERSRRHAQFEAAVAQPRSSAENLHNLIPCLAAGGRLEHKPIVANGEFQWGYVLTTPGRLEGIECSDLVAVLLSRIDGRTSVGELVTKLQEGSNEAQRRQVEHGVLSALQVLYIDGAISELRGR
jgi:flavin-dependent dehydrogenase